MIHNGIEYGDMQLISEAYWVMKNLLKLDNGEMSSVFSQWNEGKLRSYLIEITANILQHKDKSGGYLIDKYWIQPDKRYRQMVGNQCYGAWYAVGADCYGCF